jgi:hypothetical protein
MLNFLSTSLAVYVQKNIGARSFCTKLALRAWSVQKRPWSDISYIGVAWSYIGVAWRAFKTNAMTEKNLYYWKK